MIYEKQIKSLERIYEGGQVDCLAVADAIALMRAAEPKDEAAEMAHCYDAANDACDRRSLALHGGDVDSVANTIMLERAAARVEGHAAGCAAGAAVVRNVENQREELRAELNVLKNAGQPSFNEVRAMCEAAIEDVTAVAHGAHTEVRERDALIAELRAEIGRLHASRAEVLRSVGRAYNAQQAARCRCEPPRQVGRDPHCCAKCGLPFFAKDGGV